MAEVEFQKVNASQDCPVSTCITNFDEDEEDEGDKEEERGKEGKSEASAGRCPDGGWRRM